MTILRYKRYQHLTLLKVRHIYIDQENWSELGRPNEGNLWSSQCFGPATPKIIFQDHRILTRKGPTKAFNSRPCPGHLQESKHIPDSVLQMLLESGQPPVMTTSLEVCYSVQQPSGQKSFSQNIKPKPILTQPFPQILSPMIKSNSLAPCTSSEWEIG